MCLPRTRLESEPRFLVMLELHQNQAMGKNQLQGAFVRGRNRWRPGTGS